MRRHALNVMVLTALAGALPAQTLLQRCIGVVPGQEPRHQLGPSPATMQYCRQLPGFNLYDQAGQRFQAGDHAGAARLLQQAAEAGNALAQLRLEMMIAAGDGVPRNAATAMRWLKAAAEQGEPAAEDILGTAYEYSSTKGYASLGVPDDWDMAAKWWQASSAQGWMNGEFSMGRAYQYGIGVPVDPAKAVFWYDKAAAQGHSQAAYFSKYLRQNNGFDGSSRDDQERAILGPLLKRTMPFTPPIGITFHHLSERLAFVKGEYNQQELARAKATWNMQKQRYDDCMHNHGDNCMPPVGPRPQ
jgi:hypothetical protein